MILVLSIIFIIKLVTSCLPNTDEGAKIYYDIDSLSIQNMDNSKEYLTFNPDDKMYSAAVSFRLKFLSTSREFGHYGMHQSKSTAGFATAYARSPVEPLYYSNQTIRKITIITLRDISPEFPAGTDVTNLFLVHNDHRDLYEKIDETLKRFETQNGSLGMLQMDLILKESIKNHEAQFRYIVELSDNTSLTKETNLIEIVPSF